MFLVKWAKGFLTQTPAPDLFVCVCLPIGDNTNKDSRNDLLLCVRDCN